MHAQDDCFTEPWATPAGTVLLHHGLARTGGLWRHWVPALAGRYRVLRPDFPGTGRSRDTPVPAGGWSDDAIVEQYIGLFDALGADKVHWVAEGLGSPVGLLIAARHPDRIASFLSFGPGPQGFNARKQSERSLGYSSPAEAVLALGVREWWARARALSGGVPASDPRILPWVLDDPQDGAAAMPAEAVAAEIAWAPSWRWDVLLPQVTCPVLIVPVIPSHAGSAEADLAERAEVEAFFRAQGEHVAVRWMPGSYAEWPEFHLGTLGPVVLDFLAEHSTG